MMKTTQWPETVERDDSVDESHTDVSRIAARGPKPDNEDDTTCCGIGETDQWASLRKEHQRITAGGSSPTTRTMQPHENWESRASG